MVEVDDMVELEMVDRCCPEDCKEMADAGLNIDGGRQWTAVEPSIALCWGGGRLSQSGTNSAYASKEGTEQAVLKH